MKYISNLLLIVGVLLLGFFGYQFFEGEKNKKTSLAEAEERINQNQIEEDIQNEKTPAELFEAAYGEAFATLEIPKLNKTLPIVEGTDADALDKGVGHLVNSVFPGENEQVLLSGHRDTVFRSFDQIEVGDQFIVNMPYGKFTYEIKETEIVHKDDTSVIRSMGEEVLVVTTCYPFHMVGKAPERFVTYAYPVK